MKTITPFLWFDDQAEEAMHFYVGIFKNSRVLGGGKPQGGDPVTTVTFELEGQRFIALNGGPHFTFTEAVSFFVDCETQTEVDELWQKLSEGGRQGKCGWLKDKFGLSWQIVPSILGEMLDDPDPEKSQRVMEAMLKMNKIEIDQLEKAYDQ